MPTTLATLHGRRFASALRQRGTSYFRLRRVELVDVTETRIAARVRGARVYDVDLADYRDARQAAWSCTCPYSGGELPCKHIYAVLLAVDEVEAGIVAVEERERSSRTSPPRDERARTPVRQGPSRGIEDDGDDRDDIEAILASFLGGDDGDAAPEREAASGDDTAPGRREAAPRPRAVPASPPARSRSDAAGRPAASWHQRLGRLLPAKQPVDDPAEQPRIEYLLSPGRSGDAAPMIVQVQMRWPLKAGGFGVPRAFDLAGQQRRALPAVDRTLVALLERCLRSGATRNAFGLPRTWHGLRQPIAVGAEELAPAMRLLAATGRVYWQADALAERRALRVDAGEPFRFELVVQTPPQGGRLRRIAGVFRRDDQYLFAHECLRVAASDVRIVADQLVRLDSGEAVELADEFARAPLDVDVDEVPEVLATLARLPGAATFLGRLTGQLPAVAPAGVLLVTLPKDLTVPLPAQLQFDYRGELLAAADERPLVATRDGLCRRDGAAEQALRALVVQHGVVALPDGTLQLARERLPAVTTALAGCNVRVLAEGRRVRSFLSGHSEVSTGIDWFELGGAVSFDDVAVRLPELLAKPATPEGFVELGDGSLGMLPASWLRRLEAIRALGGEVDGDVVRVPSSRALLLDALLSAQEQSDVVVDAAFAQLRQRLAAFRQVEAVGEPASFAGTLRPYQREGLGWLRFLREFGLGGCLADDMGLGKTVQVLAHLSAVCAEAAAGTKTKSKGKSQGKGVPPKHPHLLVAPRSVLGNWRAEAARFAPGLRVLDFSAPDRWRDGAEERLRAHDLVLTTYALLRADAPRFVEQAITFDHAILDEAQAVKNAASQGSKAVRLLTARHRLVLTGTPVENHLGDLWSLFEFLNPGMLGRLPAFRALFGKDRAGEAMAQHRELVQRALRPVLLRRTKQQVLKDLPDKVEQTLWCELGPAQRRRYDALRRYYQKLLLGQGGELANEQRFVVLEALLRLRQAACHEALLPGGDAAAESAKFDELLPRLEELAAEGHKALVFSQFTSVLDLLEPQLRQRGLVFERLDGQTKRRAERVARFQTDAKCPVFLISLKAGGFGLNLTAASYVFVLDPWWNPAAEMQAIDRAHRIGQQRVVNAYRLVCRGTVEERVLELQAQKKALCEAILGNERSLLQDLTRADLELLLGG